MVANPNHIGCHTIDTDHEEMFSGTQEIEHDLIRICAEEIFKGEPQGYDGYVASGGTEANIQAMWIYRNFFMQGGRSNLVNLTYSTFARSKNTFARAEI